MKKIGLIDVDSHNFPNLALMKISAYHKQKGDTVEWAIPLDTYNTVYQSKVFDETYSPEIMWEPHLGFETVPEYCEIANERLSKIEVNTNE